MKSGQSVYGTNCATPGCTSASLADLNKEAAELAATIQRNFEELGI